MVCYICSDVVSVHKKLEESRAPNVLTIDYNEEVKDSTDSEEGEDEDQGFVSRQDNQPSDEEPQLSPSSSTNTASATASGTASGTVQPHSPRLKPAGQSHSVITLHFLLDLLNAAIQRLCSISLAENLKSKNDHYKYSQCIAMYSCKYNCNYRMNYLLQLGNELSFTIMK